MPVFDCGRVHAIRTMPEIAHFIAYLGTAMGGPVHSMAAYARFLVDGGCSVTVYSAARESDGESIQFDPRVKLVHGAATGRSPLRHSNALRQPSQIGSYRPDSFARTLDRYQPVGRSSRSNTPVAAPSGSLRHVGARGTPASSMAEKGRAGLVPGTYLAGGPMLPCQIRKGVRQHSPIWPAKPSRDHHQSHCGPTRKRPSYRKGFSGRQHRIGR